MAFNLRQWMVTL